jgi:hypothetical protein
MDAQLVNDYKDFMKRLMLVLNKQNIAIGKAAGLRDDSRLIRSFETKTNYRAVQFLANEYLENVDKGRRPFSRKIPINVLIDWIRRYGISSSMSTNQLAFVIQTSIYKKGIAPKNIKVTLTSSMLDILEKRMTDELEDAIADEFVNSFRI